MSFEQYQRPGRPNEVFFSQRSPSSSLSSSPGHPHHHNWGLLLSTILFLTSSQPPSPPSSDVSLPSSSLRSPLESTSQVLALFVGRSFAITGEHNSRKMTQNYLLKCCGIHFESEPFYFQPSPARLSQIDNHQLVSGELCHHLHFLAVCYCHHCCHQLVIFI